MHIVGFTCPENSCVGIPCSCDDLEHCRVCHDGQGCAQCDQNYFKKDTNSECFHCQETFGDNCMHCSDYQGCQQCANNIIRFYDENCGLWYCEDDDDTSPITTPLPAGEVTIEQFQTALEAMATQDTDVDENYIEEYALYAEEFDKLNKYTIDGSDNYEELKFRYNNYIATDDYINELNANYGQFYEYVDVDSDVMIDITQIDPNVDISNILSQLEHYDHTFMSDLSEEEQDSYSMDDESGGTLDDIPVIRRLIPYDVEPVSGPTTRLTDYTDLRNFATPVTSQGMYLL